MGQSSIPLRILRGYNAAMSSTVADLFALLESRADDARVTEPVDPAVENALHHAACVLLSHVDQIQTSDLILPDGYMTDVQNALGNEQAMSDLIAQKWAEVFVPPPVDGELDTSEALPIPDDNGKCLQVGTFFMGVICMPSPNCLLTDLGCSPGVIKLGWCFMHAFESNGVVYEGCRCMHREMPILVLLALLALAAWAFGPVVVGPIRVLIQRVIQRGLIPAPIVP